VACGTAHADEPVVVIDLRPGDPQALASSRAELRAALGAVQGLTVRDDAGLDAGLGGGGADGDRGEVTARLAEARAAFGDLDCARASAAADRAIDTLAARQASGLDDGGSLRSAWAIVLVCADQDGDRRRAQRASDRLRGLGLATGTDAGIAPAIWDRYPEIDASTDRDIVAVTVDTDPDGAAVWIDHVAIGRAPVTIHLPAGEHVVAAGLGAHRLATRVTLAHKPVTAQLQLVDRSGPHAAVATLVEKWRDGSLSPTAEGLAQVMAAIEVRFAVILAGTSRMQLWALAPGSRKARKIDDASAADTMAIGAMIVDRVTAWDHNAPDPDQPLLVETRADRDRRRGPPEKWWVYAAIVGAVVVGTAILYFQDSAENRQQIVIRF
jgi:hypothetical protein